jgi:SAM-dependent methyltransferase
MPQSPLRPEFFEREDEAPDDDFYAEPRLVLHIDEPAIAAVGALYAELLPPGGEILDLMSSWRSHLPAAFSVGTLVGLGMNATELAENPQLDRAVVQDLNRDPRLPFESESFDGAINTVSVQYLTRPLEVFAEVHRVLRPGAPFIVTFSNRCFPSKAVRIWRSLGDAEHVQLVAAYFQASAAWTALHAEDRSPNPGRSDPLYAVHACKAPEFCTNATDAAE